MVSFLGPAHYPSGLDPSPSAHLVWEGRTHGFPCACFGSTYTKIEMTRGFFLLPWGPSLTGTAAEQQQLGRATHHTLGLGCCFSSDKK